MTFFEPFNCLTSADRNFLETAGFGTTVTPPFDCVHHAFEHQANHHPDAIAVIDYEKQISYRDLDRQSNCLATQLRLIGIGPNSRVCILVERSIHMIIGILGVLKAGAAYIPLDGNIVSSTGIEHIVTDSDASVILVLHQFADRVSDKPVLCLEDIICQCAPGTGCQKPEDRSSPDDSVYIIYTSGKNS